MTDSRGFNILVVLVLFLFSAQSQIEKLYLKNKTPEYKQIIEFYENISKKSPYFKLITCGKTDSGNPLHLFVISKSKQFNPDKLHRSGKVILMINNGIHPGEPDGIDASINIVKSFADNPKAIPDNVVICIVPVFNIDGCLRRNSVMRMNQNGPEEFGFRGNGKNLDLNRDFVKCDAENTRSLIKIFHQWNPEIFIDTHVSNGADYPYTMTLIYPNSGKSNQNLRQIALPEILTQEVSNIMKKSGEEICPYVESVASTPDSGLYEFNQTPRYLTGFTTLFNCISYVTESHMLKPYLQRVNATIEILNAFISVSQTYDKDIIDWKKTKESETKDSKEMFFNWKHNENLISSFNFKGYKAGYKTSSISNLQRLYYDRNEKWEKEIPFHNYFIPGDTIVVPEFYVISQAWSDVIEILRLHDIELKKVKNDSLIKVDAKYIESFKTVQTPYEGHYLHYDIKAGSVQRQVKIYKGDFLIPGRQIGSKFLAETLEPESKDGFFAWNFFDAVLQQKEWFSDYAFEEDAEKILHQNPELKIKLELEKSKDEKLKNNHWQQLNYIFQHSKYKEASHNLYPVYKIYSQ